eukprot:COSAG02_NODE_409_length_22892_cov_11.461150_22_plen_571_part_00
MTGGRLGRAVAGLLSAVASFETNPFDVRWQRSSQVGLVVSNNYCCRGSSQTMSVYSAAKAVVEESDVELDSPAALMEIYLRPSVMLLRKLHCSQLHVLAPALDHPTDVATAPRRPCGFNWFCCLRLLCVALKQRLVVHRNAQMCRLLAAEQRLAWARAGECDDLRAVAPLQVRDSVLMYSQMLSMGTADQFQTLKRMRGRREAAPYAPSPMTAAEKKALRDAPTRDEIVAQLIVPDRDAFRRFREAHWSRSGRNGRRVAISIPVPVSTGRDDQRQQYLCLHARRPIGAYHMLSQHFYTYAVNPNVGWHVEQAPGLTVQVSPSTSPDADQTKRRRQEIRRKTDRDQLEIQKIQQSIRWFECQLQLVQDGNNGAAVENVSSGQPSVAIWGADDPEREQKLQRGLDNMVAKLPTHLADKRTAAAAPSIVANLTNDAHDQTLGSSHSEPPLCPEGGADIDATQAEQMVPSRDTPDELPQLDQSPTEPSSWVHWREQRFAAIDRRLGSMRAAKRLDANATRRQADARLQSRIKLLDSDTSLVEDWEYRYKRRIAWSRIEARRRRFEAEIHRRSIS